MRQLLETSAYGIIEELAAAEKINASYVSRVLCMTLLAPDIVEAILDGRHVSEISLTKLMNLLQHDAFGAPVTAGIASPPSCSGRGSSRRPGA